MITLFEEYTKELNDQEKNEILPILVKVFQARKSKTDAITNKEIVNNLDAKFNITISGARIRKIVNVIRMTGMVERLVATSSGYYVSNNSEELLKYEESLMQRAESIEKIAEQIRWQRKRFEHRIK